MEFTQVKLEIFIPEDHVFVRREAVAFVGAGIIGNYDHCATVTEVRGYWRPLEGADPFEGTVGKISEARECKVEVNCPREAIPAVIRAVRKIHPYEEPLINIIPLANDFF